MDHPEPPETNIPENKGEQNKNQENKNNRNMKSKCILWCSPLIILFIGFISQKIIRKNFINQNKETPNIQKEIKN